MLLSGEAADETDDRGRPVKGDTMLLLLNGGFEPVTYTVPAMTGGGEWVTLIDTASDDTGRAVPGRVTVPGFSLQLLRFGVERRLTLSGATSDSAALVNTAAVSGGAAYAGVEGIVHGLVYDHVGDLTPADSARGDGGAPAPALPGDTVPTPAAQPTTAGGKDGRPEGAAARIP
jgi:hypothetical protein